MSTSNQTDKKVLSVFDFDGTLTRHDSFIPFLRFAFGNRFFTRRLIKLAMPSIQCLRRKLTRDELKEILISTFLTGIEEKWVQEKAELYCNLYWERLMRASGLLAVASEVSSGVEVTLCSASPKLVLQPFAERLGVKLIGTELESEKGILTGRITGHNCRCIQKINRLEAIYGSLDQYHLRAWGDTRGDYELLAAAKDAHWRHFHPNWDRKRAAITRLKATSFKG
ncbi:MULTISPECIES: HAD family hydrolase [Buttiauxella]|jgi:HAD superfamily hydrolase (TIGR01490 family)|uniref:Phosphoserine phosphatase n=1 Tax=Buttiauxella ferragutiae ATCC 51602 TaxID=1354252 RepID=A0ABX2W3A4_9ENTR|nr:MULTISPECIES: HAD family hydrolase [Buttiauxella]MCE0826108.1 HAD-IB family hydrolase [Buttiauxella ferragutiae]OAT25029.1 phosphoserine phosphatase [Buttiauxella ferragutiae ATCC 51602]TDN52248.1 HAD superfamily hydrolase (TIGR01490 family) [Buttiauxella sp. JUb87]UNK59936.1 HAD-IB family hydrolase [Buttiauxella ferragutiae]